MLVLCGGAFGVGIAASLAIPFAPFGFALILAIGLASGWAVLNGIEAGQVILSAFALLVASQVGYGIGLVFAAAAEGTRRPSRRASRKGAITSSLSDLHIGEKP